MDTPRSTSRITRALAALAWSVCTLPAAATALAAPDPAAPPVTAVIDASRTSAPIHPSLYGMFIEHAGSLVYRGMWAELVDDRKFFNPIAPEAAAAQPARRGPFGGPPRRWTPIGPAERVTMDAGRPYVGDHSPAIALHASEPRASRRRGWHSCGTSPTRGASSWLAIPQRGSRSASSGATAQRTGRR